MKGKTEMKQYTLLILLAVFSLAGHAQPTVNDWFEQANAAYNMGNYDSARIVYEKIWPPMWSQCRSILILATPIIKCANTRWRFIITRRP